LAETAPFDGSVPHEPSSVLRSGTRSHVYHPPPPV